MGRIAEYPGVEAKSAIEVPQARAVAVLPPTPGGRGLQGNWNEGQGKGTTAKAKAPRTGRHRTGKHGLAEW